MTLCGLLFFPTEEQFGWEGRQGNMCSRLPQWFPQPYMDYESMLETYPDT
jgi:hypothetical protein